ncbi:MAG: metallophosphoesterase family protein [Ardenticatenaceae bacterium]|nr:metallophosphoesterase family protein [Ardenticatenaceae bacterium]MCB9446383.1 metallophosphoesterase family protein [Ardenticatenaceae bacterium]
MMKIAVISDIHGNLPALETAVTDLKTWQPDQVIVNGDIVNRGPKSRECLQLIREKQVQDGWIVLRGNHEDFVVGCGSPDTPHSGPRFEIIRFACWAHQQLNGEISFLKKLPDQFSWLAPDGSEFRVTHASMRNNRDGIYHNAPDEEIRPQITPAPAVFVTGHTHRPFIRQVDNTLIVNAGSIGTPFDKDTRPSYGRFTWQENDGWRAEIVRLDYDHNLIEQDYVATGFLSEAGPLTQLMLVELRKGRGLIYRWGTLYEKAILAGEITVEESVRRLLAEEDNLPYLGAPGWNL